MRFLLTLLAMFALAVSVGCDSAEKPPAKPAAGADKAPVAPAEGSTTSTEDTTSMQSVSLKLPGMT